MLSTAQHLRPWHELPIAVIDLETTGADPAVCLPVEIAIVRFEDGKPIDRWSSLLNIAPAELPAEATAVHGITPAMLADAPPLATLTELIEVHAGHLLHGAVPCSYNAPFDRTIFHRHVSIEAPALGLAYDREAPWLDPLVVVRDVDRWVSGKGRLKLAAACQRRGITIDDAHRALADAEAAGRLLYSLRERVGNMTVTEVLRRMERRREAQDADFEAWRAKQSAQEGA